jgi:cytochrome c5
MKRIFIAFASIVLISCGSTKSTTSTKAGPPIPTQADLDRGLKKHPSLTMDELMAGKDQYQTNCGKCHALKNPGSRNEADWTKVVPRMAAKAQKKAGKEVIDAAMQESILKYLSTMAKP